MAVLSVVVVVLLLSLALALSLEMGLAGFDSLFESVL